MKAVIKDSRTYGGVRIHEIPKPTIEDDEVLVRVTSASICGSDVHLYRFSSTHHFVQTPIVMGHEFAGVIEGTGKSVTGTSVGDRVAIEAVDYCGECRQCVQGRYHICENFRIAGMHRNGGFSEWVAVKNHLVHRLPLGVDLAFASWVEPLSVAVHAVEDRSEVSAGDVALVTGPGPIGLLVAQVLRVMGVEAVVAGVPSDSSLRLPAAAALGFRTVQITDSKPLSTLLLEATGRSTVDWAFECSGAPSVVGEILRVIEKGRGATFIGLFAGPVQLDDFASAVRRELDLKTTFSATSDNYTSAIRLLEERQVQVEPLSTRYSLDAVQQAFEDSVERKVIKPVLQFDQ